MNKNALIIGCGNIGALYDIDNNRVLTHAKALALAKKFNLFFYDTDHGLSKKIANKYKGVYVEKITDELLNSTHWISLCSPTYTHYSYLEKLLYLKNKFVLCEKPVSYNLQEIDNLKEQHKKSSLVIYVNYIRRFQPAYINIKKKYFDILKQNKLKECTIDYYRGFINNSSHAFDLLEFLLDTEIDFKNIQIYKKEYDVFKNDPTVSLTAEWENSNIIVNGHTNVSNPVFQVKLVFDSFSVEFLDSGNKIYLYDKNDKTSPVFYQEDCLKNYMQNVLSYFINTKAINENSNFLSSLTLNKKLLTYIGH